MIRKSKALGLAILSVLAMSVVAASAAQASEFHSEEETVVYEGTQVVQHVFKIWDSETKNTVVVTCKVATFTGTNKSATKTTSTATLSANYQNCKLAGLAADVNMGSCSYLFHTAAAANTATVDVVCTTGSIIKVTSTVTNCVVEVGPQTGLQHVTFTETGAGSGRDIDATIAVGGASGTGVAYTENGSECPHPGNGTGGEYSGTATIKGFKDEGGSPGPQQGIWVA
jgi:hypothetical protein